MVNTSIVIDETTDQERRVLLHYLKNPSFVGCPAEIESALEEAITRAWAKTVCERLADRGILQRIKRKPRRHRNTTDHYFLKKNDRRAFLEVARILLSSQDPTHPMMFIESTFCQNHLNDDLVEDILSVRDAAMDLEFSRPLTPEEQKVVDSVPKGEVGTDRADEATTIGWNALFSMVFPVLRHNVSIETKMEQVKNLNLSVFEMMFATGVFGRSFLEVVREHYETIQRDNLVLPIRTLIQVSPAALKEFLFGDWRPVSIEERLTCCSVQGTGLVDHVLVSLLFRAIADVSATLSVPSEGPVVVASIRGPHLPGEREALIEFLLRSSPEDTSFRIVSFDAHFNTGLKSITLRCDGNPDREIAFPNPSSFFVETWITERPKDPMALLERSRLC